MFQFLQPIWLWGITGIIIPVIIHLWNHKPGKTLKIGSITLLTASSRQYAKQVKPADILLLILRCLLILLLALIMASPVWRKPFNSKQRGWVLMDKQDSKLTYAHFKSSIDSLLAAGFELHDFNAGFKKENLQQILETIPDSVTAKPVSYWNRITVLNEEVPATLPIQLFTGSALKNFSGNRPVVSLQLNWHTYIPSDADSAFITDAYLNSADSMRIVLAGSMPSGNQYTFHDISLHEKQDPHFQLAAVENKLMVAFNNSKPFAVDTAGMEVSIFTDTYQQDAHYVEAAIKAVQQFSKRKIRLSFFSKQVAIPAKQDWLFWLSDQPLPAGIEASNIFRYEKGNELPVQSWLTKNYSSLTPEPISLYKAIKEENDSSVLTEKIWEDGFGHALLSLEVNGNTKIYHFFSHFDPAWNELCWNNAFPSLLYELLVPEKRDSSFADRRIIDSKQLQPENMATEKSNTGEKFMQTTALTDFLWPVLFIVFFIERILSFHYKKNNPNA